MRRKAEDLAGALAASEEYRRVQAARKAVEEHTAAQVMLRDLETRRAELEKRQLAGETISNEELEQFQKVSEVVMMNPYVRDLLQAEWDFAHTLMEVQQILAKAIGAELSGLGEGADAAEGAPEQAPGSATRSRIILPGGRDAGASGKLWTPR
ncbi:MAG TPA: YlbF family regulator [Limnochordia bacterium]